MPLYYCRMVGEGGFEPPEHLATDLQSAPFGQTGVFSHRDCKARRIERLDEFYSSGVTTLFDGFFHEIVIMTL